MRAQRRRQARGQGAAWGPPLLLAIPLLALAGCTPEGPRPSGFGPVVRVCQGMECRDQPTDLVTAETDDRRRERPVDPDQYRGENPAALREAALGGDPRAAYLLGQVEEYGLAGRPRRPSEAARWYAQAAEAGNPWAQFRLAQLHERGNGVPRSPARALELTSMAAQAGHPPAAYNLGMMAMGGRGLQRDPGEAVRWLTVAAEGGVPEAQYNLGVMYMRGEGVSRELYRGLTWMRSAAQNGHPAAQKAVGRIYMTGLETMGQDLQEARSWLTLAAGRGDREAQRWLAEIDRAEREERDFQRYLAARAAETQAYIAGAIFAAMIAPPPVVYVYGW